MCLLLYREAIDCVSSKNHSRILRGYEDDGSISIFFFQACEGGKEKFEQQKATDLFLRNKAQLRIFSKTLNLQDESAMRIENSHHNADLFKVASDIAVLE